MPTQLLPLLNMYMLNLRVLHQRLKLSKLPRSLRLPENNMILDLIPPTEKNKLLILSLFIDTPRTADRERSRVCVQMRHDSFENSVKFIFPASLDKAPSYSENRCIQWDFGCRWLSNSLAYIFDNTIELGIYFNVNIGGNLTSTSK